MSDSLPILVYQRVLVDLVFAQFEEWRKMEELIRIRWVVCFRLQHSPPRRKTSISDLLRKFP
jgi:hypothetical protein